MLKLPTILWGTALLLWGISSRNVWMFGPGLLLLGLGLLFFRWDCGTADSAPKTDDATGSGV